ncbi:MAG: DNA polymerase III subunit gamma/tau [Candidatus Sungiibacteriota bacterium]
MSHQVLYRKYRPKDFSEIVGQEHVVRPITNAIKLGKIAHAYLFSGPRGVGKTTIARLVAKAANCQDSSAKPCNKCEPCLAFNDGRSLDLIEIDAASNRGIDEIRELREAVRFSPAGGNKKTYIIDEVHMLTKEAFNALLKTLEEPPAHAIFVLATTELDKVPATIVSRTQHYDFRRPQVPEIVKRLKTVAAQENVNLDEQAAHTIAFVAEGSLRDAESILGKILAVEGEKVTEEEVNEILGVPKRALLRDMFASIAVRDSSRALRLVNDLASGGFDQVFAIKMLIQYFRNMLLLRIDPTLAEIIKQEMPEEDMVFVAEEGKSFSDLRVKHALSTLIDALMNFKRSPIPQLPLELALLEIIQKE